MREPRRQRCCMGILRRCSNAHLVGMVRRATGLSNNIPFLSTGRPSCWCVLRRAVHRGEHRRVVSRRINVYDKKENTTRRAVPSDRSWAPLKVCEAQQLGSALLALVRASRRREPCRSIRVAHGVLRAMCSRCPTSSAQSSMTATLALQQPPGC